MDKIFINVSYPFNEQDNYIKVKIDLEKSDWVMTDSTAITDKGRIISFKDVFTKWRE